MNIFVLDKDPTIAAQMQCDKHVVKMVLESAQIMSTVRVFQSMPAPYKPTHIHHPCVKWAAACEANYMWLWHHATALSDEYTFRYNKKHKCDEYFWQELLPLDPLIEFDNLHFVQCMPEQYKCNDVVQAYRNYYLGDKARFAVWNKGRSSPDWWTQ